MKKIGLEKFIGSSKIVAEFYSKYQGMPISDKDLKIAMSGIYCKNSKESSLFIATCYLMNSVPELTITDIAYMFKASTRGIYQTIEIITKDMTTIIRKANSLSDLPDVNINGETIYSLLIDNTSTRVSNTILKNIPKDDFYLSIDGFFNKYSWDDIMKFRNFGPLTARDIAKVLIRKGYACYLTDELREGSTFNHFLVRAATVPRIAEAVSEYIGPDVTDLPLEAFLVKYPWDYISKIPMMDEQTLRKLGFALNNEGYISINKINKKRGNEHEIYNIG